MKHPDFPDLFRVFGRIGLLSFGGPAAQIALMHKELVEDRDWLSEQAYLRALSLCMLLPGPEAMQLATYAGWRLRGVPGGIVAGLLFVLPGAAVIAVLAVLYQSFGQLPFVQAGFLGIKACVIIVVLQALLKVAGKALDGPEGWAIATLSFVAVFVFDTPFPIVIILAGLWGFLRKPQDVPPPTPPTATRRNSFKTIAVWGALWAAPLMVLYALDQTFLVQLGLFFSKLAVVSFGGAYAVLSYMTQTVVTDLGWITTDQMIDALGLAETTPGPLILVTEFVAILAGFAQTGLGGALAAGLVALWVTFTPCFLWIFLAGPFLDQISAKPRLSAALRRITAAIVGVIANLSIWFGLHVLFETIDYGSFFALPLPQPGSFNIMAGLLVLAAAGLMLRLRLGIVPTMFALAPTSILLSLV